MHPGEIVMTHQAVDPGAPLTILKIPSFLFGLEAKNRISSYVDLPFQTYVSRHQTLEAYQVEPALTSPSRSQLGADEPQHTPANQNRVLCASLKRCP